MTIQATAIRTIMRALRQAMSDTSDPLELRRGIDEACRLMPAPPSQARFEQLTIAGTIAAVQVTYGDAEPERALLYLHGGGYLFGSSMTTHRDLLWRLAQVGRAVVLSVDYRLAPEHPFPAAVEDAVAAYRWLLQSWPPESLAIAGDSAGGGLALATLLKLRDERTPLPAAAVLLSPWTDLAATGQSLVDNRDKDTVIPGDRLREGAELYLAGADPREPYASPLYGDLTGLPPILIQVGSDEVLLDDSRRLAHRLEDHEVPVVLDVWQEMPHVWQVLAMFLPEGKLAIERIGYFLRGHQRRRAADRA